MLLVAGNELVCLGGQRHLLERLIIGVGSVWEHGTRCDAYAVCRQPRQRGPYIARFQTEMGAWRVCLLTVPGAVVGFVFAWAGSSVLRLFGTTEIVVVPVSLAVVALYAVVVVIAAGVPTLRVLRANPARVLDG